MCAAEDIIAVCHEGGSEITQVKLSLGIQIIICFPWHSFQASPRLQVNLSSNKYSFRVQILKIFILD